MNNTLYGNTDYIDTLNKALANAKRNKKHYWFNVIEWSLISLGVPEDEYKPALELAKTYHKFTKLETLVKSL